MNILMARWALVPAILSITLALSTTAAWAQESSESVTLPRIELNRILTRLDQLEHVNRQLSSEFTDLQQAVESPERPIFHNASHATHVGANCATSGGCDGGCCDGDGYDGGCCGFGNRLADGNCWCRTCPGVTFDAELLLYRVHNSDRGAEHQDAFSTGSRFTVGYMGHAGRSLRARYFEFATLLDNGENLELETIDLEYAGRFTLGCCWYGEVSGGVRWASFDEERDFRIEDSIGPMLGVEIRTDVTSCFTLYGRVRQSYQFGTGDQRIGPPRIRSGRPVNFGITELEIGGELNYDLAWGTAFARGGFAAQQYTGIFDGSDEDLGLVGMAFAVGITR